jgi:hypothetical protein
VARDFKFVDLVKQGKIRIFKDDTVAEVMPNSVLTESRQTLPADTIVCSTGLTTLMEDIKVSEQHRGKFKFESDGFWLYKGCILPGVSNLYFSGFATAIFMLLVFNI